MRDDRATWTTMTDEGGSLAPRSARGLAPLLGETVGPVMVAVSTEGCDAGVRFAVAEAVRGGGDLHVVHVLDGETGSPAQAARTCLQAVERARDLVGQDVAVTSEIFHGDLIEGLVGLSRRTRLVVIQRTDRGGRRSSPRSTCIRLAARADAPVMCVPSDWTGRATGTVTVGVGDASTCVPLVRQALVEASVRASRLLIVHVDPPAGTGSSEIEVRHALVEAQRGLEEVAVEVAIVNGGSPADALVLASESSELLVVGRRHPLAPRRSRLGPVARRVVRESMCPALLLTPSESTSSAEWVFRGRLA